MRHDHCRCEQSNRPNGERHSYGKVSHPSSSTEELASSTFIADASIGIAVFFSPLTPRRNLCFVHPALTAALGAGSGGPEIARRADIQ
jgi:hypothetical protein